MEQELRNILIQVAQGTKHYNLAQRQVLNLFGVSGSTFRIDKYGDIYEAKPDESPCEKCKYTYAAHTDVCKHCLRNNDADSEYYRKAPGRWKESPKGFPSNIRISESDIK